MMHRIAVLAGDGVGPEVIAEVVAVLERIAAIFDCHFELPTALIGGTAIDATSEPLPENTVALCADSDAILLGAVGGPKWSNPNAAVRPEQGLLAIRKHFELFANLRPVRVFEALIDHAPLRAELLTDVDILFVRELTGGIYFGPSEDGDEQAYDTLVYSRDEVARIAKVAFEAALKRRRKVTSVDKANVLASMRLWRRVTTHVGRDYSSVELEHQLVDSCAMHLMCRPSQFDVVLAGNMFGDILSDETAILAGSLGMLPSASLAENGFGLYEPIHGSAPDIAGQGLANPIAAILSAAMMLTHSLSMPEASTLIENAVETVLKSGKRTKDLLIDPADSYLSTSEMGAAIRSALP